MLTNVHQEHTIVATLPYATTPKDHLTAPASKGTLATDATVQVNMGEFSFTFCYVKE